MNQRGEQQRGKAQDQPEGEETVKKGGYRFFFIGERYLSLRVGKEGKGDLAGQDCTYQRRNLRKRVKGLKGHLRNKIRE